MTFTCAEALAKSSKMHTLSLIFIFIFFIHFCVCKRYYNHTLYRVIPKKKAHMDFLNDLVRNPDIDFWKLPGSLRSPVDFIVSPDAKPNIWKKAKSIGMPMSVSIEDVQKAFNAQTVRTYIRTNIDSFNWNNYYRLEDINQWLRDLSRKFPTEMQVQSIGKTYKNKDILVARIALRGSKMRSKVIVEGGIHAREWISPAFVTYFLNQIIRAPTSKNDELKKIALTYEWYFVPVLNPDGYDYSHFEDRLWRKNCHGEGVDLNRNFEHDFGSVGVSFNNRSNLYCGPHAFSERETVAMANFIKSRSDNLEYYLSFHSYGQFIMLPYANMRSHEENYGEVNKMCNRAKSKIAARYKTKYSVGTTYSTLGYLLSGASTCWVKKQLRVPYVLTFELRDQGSEGFALPPKQIIPTCLETMDGMLSLLTPHTSKYSKLRDMPPSSHRSAGCMLDKTGIVFNLFLFILIRSD